MESISSLILTKLRPPANRSKTIWRERLLRQLALEPNVDLTLVCAPAGYGKTTLLVDWTSQLNQAGANVSWYSLDENDNHPITFGTYLIASLEHALGTESGLGSVHQVLRASTDTDLLTLLPTVINSLCETDHQIALVLDDYHLIRTPLIHKAVEFLISHRPENFHIVIGSRSNPALPLSRWRARGRLVELRASELRFVNEETKRFLSDSMDLELPDELITRLVEQVEGWPAGLQLTALSLANHVPDDHAGFPLTGGRRQQAEFLLNEVVNQLPEELQSFLLETSIFERMNAAACDAILGLENSANILVQLEQANLFIVVLNGGESGEDGLTWYRYHHLFRDFLLSWLTISQSARALDLHRAAAKWFAAHGLLYEGAYHAFRSGDWSFAAAFVELHSFTLIIQSDIATINEWCSSFPETVMSKNPMLCIFQAFALAYRFQGKYRNLVEARLHLASLAMENLVTPGEATGIHEFTAVVHTFLAMIPDHQVDAIKLLDLSQSHLAGYPPGDSGRFPWLLIAGYAHQAINCPEEAKKTFEEALPFALQSGLFFGMVEATFHLARLAISRGHLIESLDICQSGQAEFAILSNQSGLVLPALGSLEVAKGCVLLEQDHLIEAEQHLLQGIDRMGWGMNPYYLMTAFLALARVYEFQGRLVDAISCFDRLDTLWPDIQLITQGCRVLARLRSNPEEVSALEAGRDWLHSYHAALGDSLPIFGLGPVGAAEAFYLANLNWMRLQILLKQPQAVQPYLDSHLLLAQDKGLVGREIELILIQAQMYHQTGHIEPALTSLNQAVSLSRPRGFVRVFDQSAILDDLIHVAVQQGGCSDYLRLVLSAIRRSRRWGTDVNSSTRPKSIVYEDMQEVELVEPLSSREIEVLKMIATGATNQVIAERFVITIGTVKSHIHHIFNKLNARTRTEAVAQARKLGLL
jgi:LuxR family maltose regulon positive regulatory protein